MQMGLPIWLSGHLRWLFLLSFFFQWTQPYLRSADVPVPGSRICHDLFENEKQKSKMSCLRSRNGFAAKVFGLRAAFEFELLWTRERERGTIQTFEIDSTRPRGLVKWNGILTITSFMKTSPGNSTVAIIRPLKPFSFSAISGIRTRIVRTRGNHSALGPILSLDDIRQHSNDLQAKFLNLIDTTRFIESVQGMHSAAILKNPVTKCFNIWLLSNEILTAINK